MAGQVSERSELNSDAVIVWAPQPGPQEALLACPYDEVFFGGARGGGKTDGMLGEWGQHSAFYGKHAIGVFFRKTLIQLEEAIERAKQIYLPLGAAWREQKKIFTMPGGARLKFRMLERDADAEKYQGHSYTRNYFEELTNWASPRPINKLRATLRSGAGVPCKFMATGNPGGPGHQWVKARYVDPAPGGYKPQTETIEIMTPDKNGVMREESISTTRVFIPSKLQDNPLMMINDPTYVAKLHQSGSEQLVRAWLDGDWDVIDGAFFDNFRSQKHVIAPFAPPLHWESFLSFDWGSARPFSCGKWVVADGTYQHPMMPFAFPRGALIRVNEWYGSTGEPNVGLKMNAEVVGANIWRRFKIANMVADPAVMNEDGGPSIGERMVKGSGNNIVIRRADNKRIPGWDQVRARLDGDADGYPMLYFTSNCVDTVRTLPALQHDEKHPEDVDTEAEDHAPDEVRYACMSRPYTRPKPPARPPINSINDMSLNELYKNMPKRRRERI